MIILTGASASGKTVTALGLAKKYNIQKAITTTTRDMRLGEVNGKDYYFIEEETFLKEYEQNLFVEHTIYNNNRYGCYKSEVNDNKVIVLDLNGLKAFKDLKDPSIISFFLECKEDTRKNRMNSRGDKEHKIEERIINDKIEYKVNDYSLIDFIINTDDKSESDVIDLIFKLYKEKINTIKHYKK